METMNPPLTQDRAKSENKEDIREVIAKMMRNPPAISIILMTVIAFSALFGIVITTVDRTLTPVKKEVVELNAGQKELSAGLKALEIRMERLDTNMDLRMKALETNMENMDLRMKKLESDISEIKAILLKK